MALFSLRRREGAGIVLESEVSSDSVGVAALGTLVQVGTGFDICALSGWVMPVEAVSCRDGIRSLLLSIRKSHFA